MFGISVIPLPYKILGCALALAIIAGGAGYKGYKMGEDHVQTQFDKYKEYEQKVVNILATKTTQINNEVTTSYVDRWHTIKDHENANVTLANNVVPDRGQWSSGSVYVHDTAAKDGDADATRASDATPSGVIDNQALAVIVSNYSRCHQNYSQVIGLQEWIRQNKAAVDEINKKNGIKPGE